jgi:FtsP/CotA-like multicopper oxidase with cupredoxin domain
MTDRRTFLKAGMLAGAALTLPWKNSLQQAYARYLKLGSGLDHASILKYAAPMVIPPAMPRTRKIRTRGGKNIDYYEIAVRQFGQQILPVADGFGPTTVWSYGSVNHPGTFNYPAFTIEAKWKAPVRVKWINELTDAAGNYLPHLLPVVDQTLHWANPPGGMMHRDMRGTDPAPYTGPVPIVTHVHGAHAGDESDGYAEAWYLPAAANIPAGYATEGTWYNTFKAEFAAERAAGHPSDAWAMGTATFQYPNDQRATTLWYHDHTLGMTRLNVYAGPAGFFLLRGGPDDVVVGVLPGPAPALGDLPGTIYYEIPIAIQDRSFKPDGQLWYPDNRAFFEGLEPEQLQIPFIPDPTLGGETSDISPIWNPEFFGNAMVVNGVSWPFLNVEPQLYRFRLLNGCNSRFLILGFSTDGATVDPAIRVFQIGAEGGFLPAPVDIAANSPYPGMILMSPAERADVIVDFSGLAPGAQVFLLNFGPDEPFGGGAIGLDFPAADPATTGQVMRFDVVAPGPASAPLGAFTDPAVLVLPARVPLGLPTVTRQVSLNEEDSQTVWVVTNPDGSIVEAAADNPDAALFGPREALLGTMMPMGADNMPMPMMWMEPETETPVPGATEVWEIFNYTMDAHPIHVHLVMFEVINREPFDMMTGMPLGLVRLPEPAEVGAKDTVIAYPGEITRIKARFDLPGQYVWHCHIVEHEDNEMMRPYTVGPKPALIP